MGGGTMQYEKDHEGERVTVKETEPKEPERVCVKVTVLQRIELPLELHNVTVESPYEKVKEEALKQGKAFAAALAKPSEFVKVDL